jgi:putative transposase
MKLWSPRQSAWKGDRFVKKSRFTESQIVEILKEYEATGKTSEICRRHGIHANTLRNWKAKYGGMEVSDVVRMKQLEEENVRLKRIVANQAMDIDALKYLNQKKW